MDIGAWLAELGLAEYVPAFRDNDIDGNVLRDLTDRDLVAMGIRSVGHRRRIAVAIARLGDGAPPEAVAQAGLPSEHRQISVLYGDMVGSTALSERLDPEDFRELIRSFHQVGVETVSEFGGFVANFIGDCVLAYFGWPLAHEDDAERAVRAGLALVQRVRSRSEALNARVSIATGRVLVGDLIREGPAQKQSAVGATPQLAAQLQALASPGQVVMDALTSRLVGRCFDTQDLGQHTFASAAQPVAVHLVKGERAWDSRFEAFRGHAVAPLLGRSAELALLLQRWQECRQGELGGVLLLGEPGVGKSRLAQALLDACADAPHWALRWQCSPLHTGTPLWPVIRFLRKLLQADGQRVPPGALDRLDAWLGPGIGAPALAQLLALDTGTRYAPLTLSPQQLRAHTLAALVELLSSLAQDRPVLLLVEDAHWIDATTLDLLHDCLARRAHVRLLALITSRPSNTIALERLSNVSHLSLNRLSRTSTRELVSRLAGRRLEPHTLDAIVEQTDGIPLFAEEVTKAVLECGHTTVPPSLHGSLMSRLDAIPGIKEVAQTAACIGREFDQRLLEELSGDRSAVASALQQLVKAEIVVPRSGGPRFSFRHALLHETAYDSVLKSRRQELHARILLMLEQQAVPPTPALLAWHATRAGEIEKAVQYGEAAGEQALAKSAHGEAAHVLMNALQLIEENRALTDWRAWELRLQYRLGQAQISTLGFASEHTRRTHERAHALLDPVQDRDMRTPVLYGVWLCHSLRGEMHDALRLADELLAASQADGHIDGLVVAHRMTGATCLAMGRVQEAIDHQRRAQALYDPQRHPELAKLLAIDPGVASACYLAWALCLQGKAEAAEKQMQRICEQAPAVPLLHANAYVHRHAALLGMLRRDPRAVKAHAQQLAELAQQSRLRMWRGYAEACMAWCLLEEGDAAAATAGFERGLADLTGSGALLIAPFFRACHAWALARSDRVNEAATLLRHTLTACTQSGLVWCEPELWRILGSVSALAGDHGAAADCRERAVQVSRCQGTRLWELRCDDDVATCGP
jgi:predicted ATPase/class 3 adenylate cyclase